MAGQLWDQLGITWWEMAGTLVGTTVLFWVFTALLSFFGQMRARVTVASVAVMVLIGAVTARAMLGPRPTATTGVLVLVTVFVWESVFRLVSHRLPRRRLTGQPQVVLRDGTIDETALHKARLYPDDLVVQMRRKGLTRLQDVALAIVESDGSITIIRAGQPVDDEFVADLD
ncbi:MAG: DUF421 domain-containing protein [Micrococcales bacterium]|nr:DUF421 domain-containing protein [Micrococcales bacterium]MCL2666759.1 DUF421 domain-containing protein [Micrococcales bacterium]